MNRFDVLFKACFSSKCFVTLFTINCSFLNGTLHLCLDDFESNVLLTLTTVCFMAKGRKWPVITLLIFNYERPCRYFLVTKIRRTGYLPISMALVLYFLTWDWEKLPPIFAQLGPQPAVSKGSLSSRQTTKSLTTPLAPPGFRSCLSWSLPSKWHTGKSHTEPFQSST